MKNRVFLLIIVLFVFLLVGCANKRFILDNVNYNTISYIIKCYARIQRC